MPAESQAVYTINEVQSDDTIRILFMGDSWAAYHQDFDTLLSRQVSSRTNKPCIAQSIGFVGAKSKEIYARIFAEIKPYIVEHPDYCIVSVGINDAVAKMGADFYVKNYSLIIEFLLSEGIIPVVIDMPDVDYFAVYQRENLAAKLHHRFSSLINETELFSFRTYRTALSDVIKNSGWYDSVIYVNAQKWVDKGRNYDLFRADRIHLNAKGYYKLDSCLSSEIMNDCVK